MCMCVGICVTVYVSMCVCVGMSACALCVGMCAYVYTLLDP